MADKVYELRVPESAEPLIENWGRYLGWKPTVMDQQGKEVENPVSALQYAFFNALQTGSQFAISQIAAQATETARLQAAGQVNQMVTDMMAAANFMPVAP